MIRHSVIVLLTVCCVISANSPRNTWRAGVTLSTQPQQLPQPKKDPVAAKSISEEDPAQSTEARVKFAIQIVSALADEARRFKDESLRSKVQARAADVLWSVDPESARALFNRAWEAAETVDEDGQRRTQEARERFLSGRGGTGFIPPSPNLRAEVLRLASLHDQTLAESFLAKMEEKNTRNETDSKSLQQSDPTEPPEVITKRLQLARQLLESGDTERAILFAGPALNRVTSPGIIFLVLLRQKRPALADQIFSTLLGTTSSDPTADATSVSLLSSYLLTPSLLVTATRNGLLMTPWTSTLLPPQVTPALRMKFINAASQVLLRPLTSQELAFTSAGVAGTCFTIKRLLPFFEQNVPALGEALQGRLNVLAQGNDALIPEPQRDFIKAGLDSNEKLEANDSLRRIENAGSSAERDGLYAMAARDAVMKGDPEARTLADKIDDALLKKSVRGFVDFMTISKSLERHDAEKALRLIRSGELSHFQRVWFYTEIAILLKSSAPERSIDLLNEAMAEAARIDATGAESAEAWVAITASSEQVAPTRKWETFLDAAKAIDRAEGYTGEEQSIPVEFRTRDSVAKASVAARSINLAALFSKLAKADIYRAADMAMSIKSESPRAVALLAVCRFVFDSSPTRNKP